MIVAQVRKERSIVYVKPPYNKMIPQELRFDDNLSPTGYAVFKGIDILSRNIGEDVFLEVKTDQITKGSSRISVGAIGRFRVVEAGNWQ